MKVKLETLFDAHPALQILAQQFFALNKIIAVGNLVEQINVHYKAIAEKQEELLAFYGKKKEDGNYDVPDEKKPFYENDLAEYLNTEVEIDWNPVKISELGDVRLPLHAVTLLEFLFLKE
jgi:hypothetical protein